MTENAIIDAIYSLYETDDANWDTGSSEYLSCRVYLNAGLQDWAMRQTWRDLWTTLADSTEVGLVTTVTAGTWDYTCPADFSYPNSWVRTTNGTTNTFWQVIPSEMIAKHASDTGYFCYFTGSVADGYTLHFNPRVTLVTGDTINYEYYKIPTTYTATTTESEIPDPYYLVYYALARLLKNDGEDFGFEMQKAQEIMDRMEVNNIQGYWDIQNQIEEPLNLGVGFGV